MRIVVLFYRIGPYHFARLREAAKRMDVVAVEYTTVDAVYAWENVEGAEGFQRKVLFTGVEAEKQSAEEVFSRVSKMLDQIRPQAVAIPGWNDRPALSALKWCCDHRVPAILMSETTQWDFARSLAKEAVKRYVVSRFSAALVGGQAHLDYLTRLGVPKERVFVGYDAVDNEFFALQAKEALEKPAPAGLPPQYFLASARFVAKKNLLRLLDAYAVYRAESVGNAPWDLVLLGDGPLRPKLEALRWAYGLSDHIHFPGFKQYHQLAGFYARAGAFIHASSTEQWGLVVNEAMAAGLPVLVSEKCGCARDLVSSGVNGFTFDPGDTTALTKLMATVSATDFPRARFGQSSREIIHRYGAPAFGEGLAAAAAVAVNADHQPRGFTYHPLVHRVAGIVGVQDSGMEAVVESEKLHLFEFQGRPIMAVPNEPAKLLAAGLERYKTPTWRRALFRSIAEVGRLTRTLGLYSRLVSSRSLEEMGVPYAELTEILRVRLGRKRVHLVTVWPPQLKRRRFYLHVFDDQLASFAFVKVAKDPADWDKVRRCHGALRDLSRRDLGKCRVPTAYGCFEYRGALMAVHEALPVGCEALRWQPDFETEPMIDTWRGTRRHVSSAELKELGWWQAYERRLTAEDATFHAELESLLTDGTTVCRVHGDFSVTNVVSDRRQLWVFDWEYCDEAGPVLTDTVGFWVSFHVGKILNAPDRVVAAFRARFLGASAVHPRVEVMLALAYRQACGFPDAEIFLRSWQPAAARSHS